MKITTLVLFASSALVLSAQEYPEFTQMMKHTNTANDALKKLEKKTGDRAVSSAERLGTVYETMTAFWRERGAADAVKWSLEGKAAAVQLASAAHAGDAEKAEAAYKTLSGTCKSCHTAHREKVGEDKYRIK